MVDRKSLAVLLVALNFNASIQDKLAKKKKKSTFVSVILLWCSALFKMYVDKRLVWFLTVFHQFI